MTQPNFLDGIPPRPKTISPVAGERKRFTAAAWRVLKFLQTHAFASSADLAPAEVGGLGYSGRICELRKDGWIIEKKNIGGGIWHYWLKGHK